MSNSDRVRPGSYARRDFLRRSAALGVGAGLLPAASALAQATPRAAVEPPRVRRRVTLGKTGIQVPDISFGTFALRQGGEAVVRHALERGITHFDTARGYGRGESEFALGRALAGGRRNRVTITTKVHGAPNSTAPQLMGALEGSLKRLSTDRVDIYLNHGVNDVARMQNPEWAEFASRAKQQGKILASGMSGHGGKLLECLEYSLENDLLDVVLVAYNYAHSPDFTDLAKQYWSDVTGSMDFVALQPELPRMLARLSDAGVGVLVMKTLRGARSNDMAPYEREGGTFAQAAFRWVLSDPRVNGLVVSMNERERVDEYLVASGSRDLREDDLALLLRYEGLNRSTQCQPGCGACNSACVYGVDISEVLRTRKYARDYQLPAIAREEYAALANDASACLQCATPTCLSVCPAGLDIPKLARETHRELA